MLKENADQTAPKEAAFRYEPCKLELELYKRYSNLELSSQLGQFHQPEAAQARLEFWQNVEKLLGQIEKTVNVLKRKKVEPTAFFYPAGILREMVETIKPKANQDAGLNNHLKSVANYARKITRLIIAVIEKNSRENIQNTPLLTKRYLQILSTMIAPLHDIIKHLGNFQSQLSSDHQVVIEHIFTKFGSFFGLDEEEQRFAAQVIGKHDNPSDRSLSVLLAEVQERSAEPEELRIIHAQILFYLTDAFTELLVVEPNSDSVPRLKLNLSALTERYQSILTRHNDPLVSSHIDPGWAVIAYRDFEVALKLLENEYHIEIPAGVKLAVLESAITALQNLVASFKARAEGNEKLSRVDSPNFSAWPVPEIKRFEEVIDQLQQIAVGERAAEQQTSINLLNSRLENIILSLAADPNSVGLRLARIVQTTYQSTSVKQESPRFPQSRALEISVTDYQAVESEYQAFNIVAVSSAINLIHYHLQDEVFQKELLGFIKTTSEQKTFNLAEVLNRPTLRMIVLHLAEHLHNQYALVVGEQTPPWKKLGHDEDSRQKKVKSTVVAAQLVANILDYLIDTKLQEDPLLSAESLEEISQLNFHSQTSNVSHLLEEAVSNSLSEEEANGTDLLVTSLAQAAHQFWLQAKLSRRDGDQAMDTTSMDKEVMPVKITQADGTRFDPALDNFSKLHPMLQLKNQLTITMALENLSASLATATNLNQPLNQLGNLVGYLFDMMRTTDNLIIQKQYETENPNLVSWANLLTTKQYEIWLTHKLAKENGLADLADGNSWRYFSIWNTRNETELFATVSTLNPEININLSFKDLDRIPLLMAAIALYLQYFRLVTKKASSGVNRSQHKKQLRQVLEIAKLINFPNLAKLPKLLEDEV